MGWGGGGVGRSGLGGGGGPWSKTSRRGEGPKVFRIFFNGAFDLFLVGSRVFRLGSDGVPGVFRGVPGCSGGVPGLFRGVPTVFRGVPGCSGVLRVNSWFYRHPLVSKCWKCMKKIEL